MCSYNEQDWTELATVSERAGADALEVRSRFSAFSSVKTFVHCRLAQPFVSTWNGFVGEACPHSFEDVLSTQAKRVWASRAAKSPSSS